VSATQGANAASRSGTGLHSENRVEFDEHDGVYVREEPNQNTLLWKKTEYGQEIYDAEEPFEEVSEAELSNETDRFEAIDDGAYDEIIRESIGDSADNGGNIFPDTDTDENGLFDV
jgi:hypothetical protein